MSTARFLTLIPLFWAILSEVLSFDLGHQIDTRSHGCGINPLLQIIEENVAYNGLTPEEILKIIDYREDLQKEIEELLRLYDDCIRTSDGMRFKKVERSEIFTKFNSFYKKLANKLRLAKFGKS